jgi:chromosome segregation ATPase
MTVQDDLERAQNRRERAGELARRRDVRVQELREAIDERRELVERLKEHREEREDPERQEELSDQIEELRDQIDQLLERLDEKRDEREEAEKLREKYADDVRRLRERREAIRAARARGDRLSEHFVTAEFNCRDGTKVPEAAKAALKAWCRDYGEPLRARFGAVRVNSGYRTRSYNAAIGGASNSVHIYDLHPGAVAVDFVCASGRPSDWAAFLEARADGLGRYATFVHADNRARIGWGRSRWTG